MRLACFFCYFCCSRLEIILNMSCTCKARKTCTRADVRQSRSRFPGLRVGRERVPGVRLQKGFTSPDGGLIHQQAFQHFDTCHVTAVSVRTNSFRPSIHAHTSTKLPVTGLTSVPNLGRCLLLSMVFHGVTCRAATQPLVMGLVDGPDTSLPVRRREEAGVGVRGRSHASDVARTDVRFWVE